MEFNKITNMLENKDFEMLYIIFRNLMHLKVPKKYIYKLEISSNEQKFIRHFNNSFPDGKAVDVEFITLDNVAITLDRKYCSNLYSITGSDEFSEYVENETDINYTAEKAIISKNIAYIRMKNKNSENISPDYYVSWSDTKYKNELQKVKLKQNEIIINIKK